MIEIPLKAEKLTLYRIGGYAGVRHANYTVERTKSREREVSCMAGKSAYIAFTGQTSPMIPRFFLNCMAYSPILSTNVRSEAEVT